MVQLDTEGAAGLADGHRVVEATVLHAEVVEEAQRLPREVAELRVRAFRLELDHDDDRDDDLVLVEAQQRVRVGQQHGGVQHIGAHLGRAAGGRTAARSGHKGLPRCGPAGRRPECVRP